MNEHASANVEPSVILERLILAGGSPRSGTTLLAKLLNAHPEIAVSMDNSVYESWSLYYYRTRQGLVQELRAGSSTPAEARQHVLDYLVREGQVWGVAPSPEVAGYPSVPRPARPGADRPTRKSFSRRGVRLLRQLVNHGESDAQKLIRHRVPLSLYCDRLRLCLKSPEIVFVLPELVKSFPQAQIVLVHRPILEIAESMYRKGFEWKLASYHRRWQEERDKSGQPISPPGVPEQWRGLWSTASDFQRCVIYATSYLRAMVLAVPKLSESVFVYSHVELRRNPSNVLEPLAKFLGIDVLGWQGIEHMVQKSKPSIPSELEAEYHRIAPRLAIPTLSRQVAELAVKA